MDGKINIRITVKSAKELHLESKLHRKPSAYVSVQVEGNPGAETRPIRNSTRPSWDCDFIFTAIAPDSNVRFDVFDAGLVPLMKKRDEEHRLGYVEAEVKDLVQSSAEDIILNLSPQGSLTIRAQIVTAESSLGDLQQRNPETGEAVFNPLDEFEFPSLSESLQDILKSLQTLAGVVKVFAGLNSFVLVAVEAVIFMVKPFHKELENEKRIKVLVGQMKNLYIFVKPLSSQKDTGLVSALEDVIRSILTTTVECVSFIQDYTRRHFIERSVSNLISGKDTDKIEHFQEVFSLLGKSLDTGIAVTVTLTSLRTEGDLREISERIKEIEDRVAKLGSQNSNLEQQSIYITLQRQLLPISYDDWESRSRCQLDTCVEHIKYVVRWALDSSPAHKLLFIQGMAGTGKSTLATTIADYFAQLKRLGAFIYFNRDMPERNRSLGVIRTLSYQLCQFDSRIIDKVVTAFENNVRMTGMPLEVQFQELITTPLNSVEAIAEEGPILIVIDALDECSDEGQSDRQQFFKILSTNIALLPSTVRVIITSRTERVASAIFNSRLPHITVYELEGNPKDIELYIRRELSNIAALDSVLIKDKWPDEQLLQKLVQRANGLFIWAAVACKFVGGGDYPEENLAALIDDSIDNVTEPLETLYRIYATALKLAGQWKQGTHFTQEACAVIGLILIAKTPLTSNAINQLLQLSSSRIIDKLGSVLRCKGPIRLIHSSFADYLSTCRNEVWYIDQAAHTVILIQNCLSVMAITYSKADLGRKRDDLNDAAIYASTYWVMHVIEMKVCPEGFDSQLLDFLEKNLLCWFEAMSSLKISWRCANFLEKLLAWVKEFIPHLSNLQELIYDGLRFASFFTDTIAAHPSLVRLSALPFAPVDSRLYRLFHNLHLPTVLGGYQRRWSKSLRVLKQQDERFYSLSFSSTGTKFLSCSSRRIRQWDALTGLEVLPDVQENEVPSLIRLWDATTGLELLPAQEVDAPSNVTFSVDDTTILSASMKGTIKQLNAITGKLVWQKRQEEWTLERDRSLHNGPRSRQRAWNIVPASASSNLSELGIVPPANYVAGITFGRMSFSPDRQVVVLGSSSDELCVVNLHTKRQMYPTLYILDGGPLKSDIPIIRLFQSIAFSPDSSQFAVGTSCGVIVVYRTCDGQRLANLRKHTSDVTALIFTRDQLISSALDGTICIWDRERRYFRQVIVEDRRNYQPLAIDPLGRSVFSTTENGTIYAWDLSGKRLAAFHGSFYNASAIALSADGTRMVSAAFQNPIRIWDISSFENIPLSRHDRGPDNIEIFGDGFLIRSSMKVPPWSTKFWDVITGKELVTDRNDQIDDIVQESPKVHLLDSTTGEIWHRPTDEPWASLIRSMGDKLQLKLRFNVKTNTLQVSEKNVWKLPLEFHCRSITMRGNIITFGMRDGRVISVYLPDTVFQKSLHPELVPVAPTDDRSSPIRRFLMSKASNLEARPETLRPPNLKYTTMVSPPATSQRPSTENRLSIPRRIPPANRTNPRAPLRPISVVQSAVSAPTFNYRDLQALMQSQAGSS
ncbi:hypothetical protein VKT23_006651 [Stygiomarasmius scandens]|uniref:C2 domain-containing protein n=1 Tax=Marasmiellus scandens TaxID=2682957 RepID=A0ABR1JNE2_9AGAR